MYFMMKLYSNTICFTNWVKFLKNLRINSKHEPESKLYM